MREIRARVSEQHGIELSNQQIQELASRRLEAILDPRTIKPSLMDELRRAAGVPAETKPADLPPQYAFEASTLYESPNGFLRFTRRLLGPLLKLFFNPDALIQALDAQTRLNKAAAMREADERRRQAEWNGLHYEILRRLVTDIARAGIETQNLALRVESLGAKVDFNERRVRGLEQTQHQLKPSARPAEAPAPPPSPAASTAPAEARSTSSDSSERVSSEGSAEGGRRRRRRRRGRRSGGGQPHDMSAPPTNGPSAGLSESPNQHADESDDSDLVSEEAIDAAGELSDVTGTPATDVEPPADSSPVEPVLHVAPVPNPPSAPREDATMSEVGDQGSGIRDHEPSTSDPRSLIPDPRSGD